jgi:hypothetical protein
MEQGNPRPATQVPRGTRRPSATTAGRAAYDVQQTRPTPLPTGRTPTSPWKSSAAWRAKIFDPTTGFAAQLPGQGQGNGRHPQTPSHGGRPHVVWLLGLLPRAWGTRCDRLLTGDRPAEEPSPTCPSSGSLVRPAIRVRYLGLLFKCSWPDRMENLG